MDDHFRIRLAGVGIEIHPIKKIRIRNYCAKYLDNSAPAEITIHTTEADLVNEDERAIIYQGFGIDSDYEKERLSIYRKIAEELPLFDLFLIHAVAIEKDGNAFLFSGSSGTGKSTHAGLWEKAYGDSIHFINDDKPLIRVTDESIFVCGSPWCGKEQRNQNLTVPIKGIACLKQARKNHIKRLEKADAYVSLINQAYRSNDPKIVKRTLSLVNSVVDRIPVFELECNTKEEAAHIAREAMEGR